MAYTTGFVAYLGIARAAGQAVCDGAFCVEMVLYASLSYALPLFTSGIS